MAVQHEQADVKVNIPVDAGVRHLVEALSAFPHVYTVDSCERDERGLAYVLFTVGNGSSDEVRRFVDRIRSVLSDGARGLSFTLSIEWTSGGRNPLARISVEASHQDELAELLLTAARSAG